MVWFEQMGMNGDVGAGASVRGKGVFAQSGGARRLGVQNRLGDHSATLVHQLLLVQEIRTQTIRQLVQYTLRSRAF